MSRPPYRSVEEALFHLQNDLEERPPAEKEIKAIIQFGETNERARCAALVRAKGCRCERLKPFGGYGQAIEHHEACPLALAAEIEAGR